MNHKNKHTGDATNPPTNQDSTSTTPHNLTVDPTTNQNTQSTQNNNKHKTKRKQTKLSNPTKGHNINFKPPKNTRFVYYNINSLRSKTSGKWKAILEQIQRSGIDITGLCETSTNWSNNKKRNSLRRILRLHFKKNAMVTSKIPNTHNETNLPGGTCTITFNQWVDKIEKTIEDNHQMARWTGTTYRLGNNRKLHYITAYRVIDQPITTKNTLASNSQQHRRLLERNILNVKPRKQFIEDFIQQFSELANKPNEYFILTIDANETMDDNETHGIRHLIDTLNLTNIYQTIHQDFEQFPTHQNGSKTIDFALCSPNTIPYITQVGYIPFHEIFDSDHRGIFFDISNDIITDQTNDNQIIRKRLIGSNSTNKESTKYIQQIYEHCFNNKVFEKMEKFLNSEYNTEESKEQILDQLNKIDEFITKAKLKSERNNCIKKGPSKWFPLLKQCLLRIQYWNILQKSKRQNINVTKRIKYIIKQMEPHTV
jgi:hypothetical protein